MKKLPPPNERIMQPYRNICLELFARYWNYDRIMVEMHEKYGVAVDEGDMRLLMAHSHEEILRRRRQFKLESAVTALSIKAKAEFLLDMRLTRAIADAKLLQAMDEARAADTMSEDEYKRKRSTLYLPGHGEITSIMRAMMAPVRAPKPSGAVEPKEDDEPKSTEEVEQDEALRLAFETGDPIKIQKAMYGDGAPQGAPRAQLQEQA